MVRPFKKLRVHHQRTLKEIEKAKSPKLPKPQSKPGAVTAATMVRIAAGSFNCRKGRVECWIIGVIVLGVWRTVVWEESVGDWGPGLLEALREIEDPRKPKGVRHPLPAVLAV